MSHRPGRSSVPLNVDLERLLAPISADQPSGESLRYQGAYDAVEELRRQDDPDLPQGVWQRELKKAEWDQVAVLCQEALETKTKDLKIAAWLLESWLYQHGFVGVEQGLRLVQGLCEGFWDSVHPQIDEDGDLDYRMAPLHWIDDRISQTIQILAITDPETDEAPAYGWLDWLSGLRLANLAQINAEAADEEIAKGKVTQEKVLVSVSLTPTKFYRRLSKEIEATRGALSRLAVTLQELSGPNAPTLSRLDENLDTILRFITSVVEQRRLAGDVNGINGNGLENGYDEPAFDEVDESVQAPAEPASGRRLRSRSDAYRQLAEAAEYLLLTEPHSPTPYLVKRAVSWGNLTLSELLAELVNDRADLETIYTLLGMKDVDL